ncbi:MAG: flagellar hook-associated protein FlgK [Acidobacteria bacterium]|nr:flagellar hook-associated protein FlgK [Acidobacteriota bacterium]
MGGLFTSLSNAAQSLDAQRYGLDVTGQNIANLNTEGYVRRRLELAERQPIDGVGGVQVVGVRASRDAFVDHRLRSELPAQSHDSAMASALSVIETSLGSTGKSIDGALSALFSSFSALSVDPQSAVARDGVVLQGTRLATAFNDMSSRLDQSRTQADRDVRSAVDQINTLAGTIAKLNQQIGDAPTGADIEPLKDQLDLSLQNLAKLTDVNVISHPNGTMDVALGGGRALVIGRDSHPLAVTNAPTTGLAEVRAGGVDITAQLTGGTLGGHLAVRDSVLPGYQHQLDQLAYDVGTQLNAVHTGGYDLNGNTGPLLYLPLATVDGAAASLKFNPALAANNSLIAASGTGAPGDNGTAKALASLRDQKVASGNSATFTEAWSQLVNKVGTDSADARTSLKTREDVVSAIQKLRDSVSGVSLDEEAGRLLQFQRAYEANARYFAAIDSSLSVLMSTFGVPR